MDTRRVVARFEAERNLLARFDHPGIARILDGGTTADGRPFFAMAVVEGVAHRDLKPSNLLVARGPEGPAPKVIDFGIAKATSGEDEPGQHLPRPGLALGTPAYMAPELLALGVSAADTRADVYSLGIVLHELLTGVLPEKDADGVARPPSALVRARGASAEGWDAARRRATTPARAHLRRPAPGTAVRPGPPRPRPGLGALRVRAPGFGAASTAGRRRPAGDDRRVRPGAGARPRGRRLDRRHALSGRPRRAGRSPRRPRRGTAPAGDPVALPALEVRAAPGSVAATDGNQPERSAGGLLRRERADHPAPSGDDSELGGRHALAAALRPGPADRDPVGVRRPGAGRRASSGRGTVPTPWTAWPTSPGSRR